MNKDIFKVFPEFETKRLKIRAFALDDYNQYVAWNGGDVPYYMDGLHYIAEGNIEGYKRLFLKNAPRMFETKESAIWCISDKATNDCIGKIEVCRYDFHTETAQIHYCLSINERGKGYMSEAISCILNWTFNILDVNRIYTYVNEQNTASANVLKKCGFQLEGIMREASSNKYTIDGHEIKITKNDNSLLKFKMKSNVCIYGCLKSEFVHLI